MQHDPRKYKPDRLFPSILLTPLQQHDIVSSSRHEACYSQREHPARLTEINHHRARHRPMLARLTP